MARRPLIVGLTGSMGMGKTTVARMFRRLGVPTYDADAAVHRLFAVGGAAVAPIAAAFPGVARDGAIDRARLSARVVGDAAALTRLEGLVHPLVRRDQARFVSACAARGHTLVLLDIPLLFESGGARRCDWVVVVSAPARVQRARVLARPAMTEDKFAALLARQMSDDEKRARADFIVPTGCSRRYTAIWVRQLVRHLQ